jgi:cytochrome c-type biogenesis protein CcmH
MKTLLMRAGLPVAALLATLIMAGNAHAIDTEPAFADPVLQDRYEGITRELRCLVCQNETIADSNATLAGDLRREVREMIAAGKTDDEIRAFMLARYGDFVLYKPRLSAKNFLLWAAPVLFLLFGVAAALVFIRRRAAEADIATETDTAGPEAGKS